MSEKVKRNILDIADPETYVLIPQRLLLVAQVFTYEEIDFRRPFPKWPPPPSRAKSAMALYPNIVVIKCVLNIMLVS